jgi:hypothetical protein
MPSASEIAELIVHDVRTRAPASGARLDALGALHLANEIMPIAITACVTPLERTVVRIPCALGQRVNLMLRDFSHSHMIHRLIERSCSTAVA